MHVTQQRILYLCSSWPHGPSFGGQLRALQIGRALQHVGKVTCLVVGADAGDEQARLKTAEEFDVEPPVLPHLSANRGAIQKLRWAADPRYLNVHGVVASEADRMRIRACCSRHDLVWLLNSRTPNIMQQWHWPHSHLDVDDVPSTYLRAVAHNGARLLGRLKAGVQMRLLKRRELRLKERFTTISVCSEADRFYLGGGDRIHVIPNGFAKPLAEPHRAPGATPPRLGFIGLCTYGPNRVGLRWFLDECWPAIRTQIPGVRFRLAGKGSEDLLCPADADVDALGWVADPADEISTWSAMIIPIRFGAGTRIKIADAFSRKCPVVSTHLGAFGYEVQDGVHLRLADTPGGFVQACLDVLRNPGATAEMAERAWCEFLDKWTWDAIAPRIWAAAEDCLSLSGAHASEKSRLIASTA